MFRNSLQLFFNSYGFKCNPVIHNTFAQPTGLDEPWEFIPLPDVDFKSNSLLVLHFQDCTTIRDGEVLELKKLEKIYPNNCHQLVVTHAETNLSQWYSGPINLLPYDSHSWRESFELDIYQSQWTPALDQPKTQAWQCLNGRYCSHREKVVNYIRDWPGGSLSFGVQIPLPEWDYSTYYGAERLFNFKRLLPLYARTAVNIITETIYDLPVGFTTEKTLYAMACEQIPILISQQGAISNLRTAGFDMFDDIVNTSYDDAPNDERLYLALELNKDLILGKINLSNYRERLTAQRIRVMNYHHQIKSQSVKFAKELAVVLSKKLL